MAELIFEPFAAQLLWTLPEPRGGEAWRAIVGTYLETLARRCQESGPCVIGHIKSFAEVPGGYLRANTTGTTLAPDTEVHSSEPCSDLNLTLNVLVYGLPAQTLASLAMKTAMDAALAHGGEAVLVLSHGHSHEHGGDSENSGDERVF